jgi:Alkylmercury lyase
MLSGPLGELTDANNLLRAAAFRLLLITGQPVISEELAKASGFELERTIQMLEDLDADGRIRRDDKGHVVGSAGLSVMPDRHEIELAGRTFWTWCAYDILGIFGALRANGTARSPSPPNRAVIELRFLEGRPQDGDTVVFRPAEELMSACDNVYQEWCPNSNLFPSRELAESWAAQHQISGRVLSLTEAADLATKEWQGVARGLSV